MDLEIQVNKHISQSKSKILRSVIEEGIHELACILVCMETTHVIVSFDSISCIGTKTQYALNG